MRCLALYLTVVFAGLLPLAGAAAAPAEFSRPPVSEEPVAVDKETPNSTCLECHGIKGFAVPEGEFGEGRKRALFVDRDALHNSVHAKQACVACHNTIEQIPHKTDRRRVVGCVQCHKEQAELGRIDEVQPEVDLTRTMVGLPPDIKMLEKTTLEKEAGLYLASIHALPRKDEPQRPNADCGDCHGTHDVPPMRGAGADSYRLRTPAICGGCHEKALAEYTNSVHGAAVKRYGKLEAAVCSDCHSAHQIASPEDDPVKLAITVNCGSSCHEEEVKSYRSTYHGQVTMLGYAHTARCSDCHNAHNILAIDNPLSTVYPDNLVETCQECHKGATASFVKFQPHGNTHDFKRFPAMWIASKFMIALLGGVFLVFWAHSLFWFRRESKDRAAGMPAAPHADGTTVVAGKYVQRFSWQVRLAHLLLALAVMTLALTGTTVLYADSFWAPTMMKLLGGAKIAAIIHHSAALLFGVLFFGHIISVLYRISKAPKEKRFRWFGPDSLIPNLRDWKDFIAMKNWFAGKGPRPSFEHWTYWEKFDYWAPFWGMFIIGTSGVMLWFAPFFGSFIPGWIFNIATIVHGEEAFLAIVFLFTVHFFNSHFRPDKFPLDIIMFTGSMPLEEFKEERADEYARLVKEGTLDDYLVDPPSESTVRKSRILGFSLVGVGLFILLLVLMGFVQNLFT
ncbi:Cytochrome c family protein precursor [hydrothermal vent metagenome]|uniref:Cytochrome c family protein n=1 Tax=hydrothermal vent metagenome TaxID=652676 RepID=A0A3B0Z4E2_9ZZZZ